MAGKKSSASASPEGRLSLQEALGEIRQSLLEASETARNDGKGAVLLLQGAELEVKFTAGKVAKAGGKLGAKFWVVDAGIDGGGETSRQLVHTLKPKFVPAQKNFVAAADGPRPDFGVGPAADPGTYVIPPGVIGLPGTEPWKPGISFGTPQVKPFGED